MAAWARAARPRIVPAAWLVAALVGLGAAGATAQPARADEDSDAVTYDFYCPDCRAALRYDHDACPQCGTAFEPLRPRVRAGEAQRPAARPADESPFADADAEAGRPPAAERALHPERGLIPSPWPQIQPPAASRFGFGSYGRVGIRIDEDLGGAAGRDIVEFIPRLSKGPYQELHFYYREEVAELPVLVKSTLAFEEDLFHHDGRFDARMALRELYAEVEPSPELALWIGARMYRGDDIYLLDFWPLDEQNTLGAGLAVRTTERQRLRLHVGFNRLVEDSFFQFQTVEVPEEDGPGVLEKVFLDRNRVTGSATYEVGLGALALKGHLELTYLPSGRRRLAADEEEGLPSELGFLIGGQASYTFGPQSFARLFVTYARGLGAYSELSVPFGVDDRLRVTDAWRFRIAAGGAFDSDRFGLHWGGYWQRFEDATGRATRNDSEQLALAARPLVYLGRYFRTGLEVSYQVLRHEGVFIETGRTETSQVTKLHLLAGVAAGKGPYARPVLYGYWGIEHLNRGARLEVARRLADEPDALSHVFGLLAEWWF